MSLYRFRRPVWFLARTMRCLGIRLALPRELVLARAGFTCWRVFTPRSRSIWMKGTSIYPTMAASSEARWWLKSGRFRWRQTMSSLYLPSSGSRFWARGRVSRKVGVKAMPYLSHPARTKPMSNSALWAASGRPSTKARKARRASSWLGAPTSMSSVMPVSWTMLGASFRWGSTKVWNRSFTCPFSRTTAPISVITSSVRLRPVVSRSKQTMAPSRSWSWGPRTVRRSSTSLI
ncbi:unknown [Firmicutes bacterium CAG:114]|nr:unknown [Firmicutes bacterium CAG:114]